METLKLTIPGNPITKKNHSRIINVKGRPMLIPSAQYKDYEKDFIKECKAQKVWALELDKPLTVKCSYYMETRRKVDLSNLLNGTDDALIAAQVIKDDNCCIIVSHDGSRIYYDKENPRVEIEISDETPTFPDTKK